MRSVMILVLGGLISHTLPATAETHTCDSLFQMRSPEADIVMEILQFVGFEAKICDVAEMTCINVCACAHMAFNYLETTNPSRLEILQTQQFDFLSKYSEKLQCEKNMM